MPLVQSMLSYKIRPLDHQNNGAISHCVCLWTYPWISMQGSVLFLWPMTTFDSCMLQNEFRLITHVNDRAFWGIRIYWKRIKLSHSAVYSHTQTHKTVHISVVLWFWWFFNVHKSDKIWQSSGKTTAEWMFDGSELSCGLIPRNIRWNLIVCAETELIRGSEFSAVLVSLGASD